MVVKAALCRTTGGRVPHRTAWAPPIPNLRSSVLSEPHGHHQCSQAAKSGRHTPRQFREFLGIPILVVPVWIWLERIHLGSPLASSGERHLAKMSRDGCERRHTFNASDRVRAGITGFTIRIAWTGRWKGLNCKSPDNVRPVPLPRDDPAHWPISSVRSTATWYRIALTARTRLRFHKAISRNQFHSHRRSAPSQSPRVTCAARLRTKRNGSGAAPQARPGSASRTMAGMSNATRWLVFGSVHQIVPRSTATLLTSGRASRTASAITRLASVQPAVTAAIASALMVTLVCFNSWRARARRDGVAKQFSVVTRRARHVPRSSPGHPTAAARLLVANAHVTVRPLFCFRPRVC